MTSIRKLLGLFMTITLVAFALPAFAAAPPTKQYGLDITSSPPPPYPQTGGGAVVQVPAGGGTVYWTISNQTASGGNSAIGSFVIKKAPGLKISNPVGPTGTVFDLATLAATGDLKVSGVGPLVPKQDSGMHQVTINFTLTPEDPCGGPSTVWPPYVVVTTGTFSSTTFAFTTNNGPPVLPTNQTTTFATGTCTMTITAPSSAAKNVAFSINVKLNGGSGGSVTLSSSDCILTAAGNPYAVTTAAAGTDIGGLSFSNDAGTTCHLTVNGSASGYGSQTVALLMYAGQLGCSDGPPANNYVSSLGSNDFTLDPYSDNTPWVGSGLTSGWGVRRGPNTDTNACVKLNCTIALNDLTKTITAICDKSVSPPQHASFEYLVLWPAVSPDDNGWTEKHTQLSYLTANPTPVYDPSCKPAPDGTGGCDYIVGLACAKNDNTVGSAAMPTIPNKPPYDAASAPQSQYQSDGLNPPQKKALACVAQQGWTAVNGLVQYWTIFIDQSDFGGRLP